MICFLTSSTMAADGEKLNEANGFVEELRGALPEVCAALFICSDPDNFARTDRFADAVRASFLSAGFRFSSFQILDRRTQEQSAVLVKNAELIVLAGGHVPTQNRFFREIGLCGLLEDFHGTLVGISAGTMNCASLVYAQPEREGEAASASYQRFLPGLGLTERMILPHYQMVKDDVLDGLRVFEDIAYPDSVGRCFYALVDGSYLLIRDGKEELRGEAYQIRDGLLRQISRENDRMML